MNSSKVIKIVLFFLIIVMVLVMVSPSPSPPKLKPVVLASIAASSQTPHTTKPPINIIIKPQHPTPPEVVYVPVSQKPYYPPPPHVYNPPSQTNPPPDYNGGGYGGGGYNSGPPPPAQPYPQLNYGGVVTGDYAATYPSSLMYTSYTV